VPAILAPGQDAICFDELVRRIEANVARLERAGIERGDRVALLSSLGPETAVITLSVACHAVCMPLSSSAPAGEAAIALKEMRASTLIVPVEGDAVAEDVARGLEIPTLRLAWDSAGESRCGTWQGPGPSDVAPLMHTSVSTARPKRVPTIGEQIVERAARGHRREELRFRHVR
jgi:acyl-CoA synthetase (AMP-forming)/AMP-acid ligase II